MATKKKTAKKQTNRKSGTARKGEHVLIRANQAGVIFGEYVGTVREGSQTFHVLKNSRKIHYWNGAAGCDELAVHGINPSKSGSRVCVVVPLRKIRSDDVVECYELQPDARKSLEGQPLWIA